MMPVADLEIKYVNDVKPGKKFGNIKEVGGQMYLVSPAMVSQFAPGMNCKIEYTERTGQDGTVWKTVTKVIGAPSVAPSMPVKHYQARKTPIESRQIFVVALLKELIHTSEGTELKTEEGLIKAVEILKRVHDKCFTDTRRDDMDDENPI